MLRLLVLVLLLANLLVGLYTQGALETLGWGMQHQREPERLAQQVAPEQLRLLPAEGASAQQPADGADSVQAAAADPGGPDAPPPAVAAKPPPTACWQIGGYSPAQAIVLNAALQNLAGMEKRWTLAESVLPARWIVYLGKFANTETAQRRKQELRDAKVEYRDVKTPALMPGLAMGTYSSEDAANTALRDVKKAGVRDAKVVQERPEARSVTLRLPAVTDTERDQVQALNALAGKTLQPCP